MGWQTTNDYVQAIADCGGERETLERRHRQELMQQWRRVYAARLHAATGKWRLPRYEWHLFSFGHAPSVNGHKAATAYASLAAPPSFVVCPEADADPAFRVSGGRLPCLRSTGMDAYVWPEGFAWTMAFTHEDGYCGPYLSRREWAEAS